MRSVAVRSSSRCFIAAVRSSWSRVLSEDMPASLSAVAWDHGPHVRPLAARVPAHRRRRRRPWPEPGWRTQRATRYAPSGYGATTCPSCRRAPSPVRILQITDLHLTPPQRRKQDWVRALDRLEPDLVLDTGDNLAHQARCRASWTRSAPASTAPVRLVMGLQRLLGTRAENPWATIREALRERVLGEPLRWREPADSLVAAGGPTSANTRAAVRVGRNALGLVGV
jgi:hypothetical protein